ncbi:thioredoxin-disulfide reductase [Candidatus Roizmanbacteria bacterium RIFCSPLOWO2_12_FULL_40_12]|uniref:Thioredoxin reductase n=1 Tax=Candidatus Roizmanbacteria bacterium RIFCSPLOWO2_01_FULL_40_42 TaxID=1802066 RepID=A0A1F7J249_9BACT|nr:MAG: thioredoxin-disulfide reductase [Candidatus Roizmanbacteria bacterium RIFCSPHIGHO2_01_FULL_40_98]OGK27597.1 MAG: thioredoxin-disulfide reductase [Candidatus Roizmanbacteria bacterium RIFCSPHIGHO2_02_FULL_40_53]OGK30379.1 MAG: thioredoxin-disulfide reductase [Candidatus Roizmanbacteria bacterium RIFCSPHIGHO2_12_41_18]OGK36151.1 MAG: thioredoxin-disulfide reductase [Candidatus Roizmanbacteria bacterium RIFCSPHIGHO2_12_FULL_40_130]OGK49677.1 MAG: thioredoxin-disulfide reductase [Candidatus
MTDKIENVLIIGGGPAGLAAAVYTARADLSPMMFAGAPYGGQLMLTSDVENYPGFASILGPELIEKMREQVKHFGTKVLDQNVTKVDFSQTPFKVTAGNVEYRSRAVIIATGAQAIWLGLPSETKLRGKGVSACATCDGFFFKEKIVGVVGGGDSAMEEALFLTKFATEVHIFHRRDAFRASKIMQDRVLSHPKIKVMWNTEVTEVLGDQKVEGVKLKIANKESDFKLDGLFLAIGHTPDTELFKGQVELDEKGYMLTTAIAALSGKKLNKLDSKYQTATSVPGVFAAGDNVDHTYRQAGTAVGMGISAALDTERWLEENI